MGAVIGCQHLKQVFRLAGLFVLLQLTNHPNDHLIHPLCLTISLSMVRQSSELLYPIQFTEVCNQVACKGLPLITDKVGRCPEQAKITIPQHFSSGASHLIFNNISNNIFRKVVLHDHYISNNWFLVKRNSLFNGCEIHMQHML